MILIRKQHEPESLRRFRLTPGADFDGMPAAEKNELRLALIKEQGYICAYCMRRIRLDGVTRIEHYEKRTAENQLDYDNLLLCCSGGEGKVNPAEYTCDKCKQDKKLHLSPLEEADMNTIRYTSNGKMISSNEVYQKDLDEVLNLNDPNGYLIKNRKAALEVVRGYLKNHLKSGQTAEALLYKLDAFYSKPNASGELEEYVGIIRWYIEKKLKAFK